MIKALLFEPTQEPLEGGAELLERWQATPASTLWLLIEDEKPEVESSFLRDQFGVHPLAIADALRVRHPPKVVDFADSTFLLLRGLDATSSDVSSMATIQLAMFVGERFLVTRSSGHSISSEKIRIEFLDAGPGVPSPGSIALRLSRTVVDRFFPLLFAIEEGLDSMESELLTRPSDDLLGKLVQQKGDLTRLLRHLQYHCQVFEMVRASPSSLLEDHKHEIADVHEQLERQRSLARLYYELSSDLMDGYLSLSAHRLNQIMQTLTIVTVIFVPITFMAGIYGMNFEYIPELKARYGYFFLLGAMSLVVSGALLFFRRRQWLGGRKKN